MKRAFVAVLGVLVLCGLYLALFRANLGVGVLSFPVVLLAFLILHLYCEMNELRKRVQRLEERLSSAESAPEKPQTVEQKEADKLEKLYRTYPDKKLQKILESREYREDAKQLAYRILKEREE